MDMYGVAVVIIIVLINSTDRRVRKSAGEAAEEGSRMWAVGWYAEQDDAWSWGEAQETGITWRDDKTSSVSSKTVKPRSWYQIWFGSCILLLFASTVVILALLSFLNMFIKPELYIFAVE